MFFNLRIVTRLFIIISTIIVYTPLILLGQKQISDLVASLGVFYIKLAQIITTRPDIFGEYFANCFRKLQDQVPSSEIIPKIQGLIIEEKPIACGSVAEVYNCTFGSQNAVVKIKRPDVDFYIDLDKQIIDLVMSTSLYKFIITYFWQIEMVEHSKKIINLLYDTIDKHLDFTQEVKNLKYLNEIFTHYFSDDQTQDFFIPHVFEDKCSANHIVMEKMQGVHLSEISPDKIDDYLDIFLNAVYDMIFIHNVMHGDLHEGNILATDDGIVFIDFGIIHEISPEKAFLLHIFFSSIHSMDADTLSYYMYTNHTDKTKPYESFQRAIQNLIKTYDKEDLNLYKFLTDLIDICYINNLDIEEHLLYPFLILIEADGIAQKYSKTLTISKIIISRI